MIRLVLPLVLLAGCQKAGGPPAPSTPPGPSAPYRPAVEDGEEKALRHAEKLGANITKKETGPGDPLITIDLSGKKITDADLKEFAGFRNLTNLILAGTPISGAGLKELAKVYSLSSLDLTGCPNVTDETLRQIGQFESLSRLSLKNTKVSDLGLKELARLAPLTELDVTGTRVTSAGIAELQKALPRCKVKK